MPAYHGPAVLEWQANRSLAFTCAMTASIEETYGGWTVTLTPVSTDLSTVEDMFPNPWHLRFPDGSLIEVDLHRTADAGVWWAQEGRIPS